MVLASVLAALDLRFSRNSCLQKKKETGGGIFEKFQVKFVAPIYRLYRRFVKSTDNF